MASAPSTGTSEALAELQELAERAGRPGATAAVLAILGVGGQILAFLLGFRAATGQPPSVGWARVAALLGLLVALGVLALLARLVDVGWLPETPSLAFLAMGAFAGGVVAVYLPSEGGPAGGLFLYTTIVLLYGTLLVGVVLVTAGIAYMSHHPWWRPLLAAPILLHTGTHAVVLVGLAIQAGGLAEAAALVPLSSV